LLALLGAYQIFHVSRVRVNWNKCNKNKKIVCRSGKHGQKVQTADKLRKDGMFDSGMEVQFKAK